MMLEVVLLYYFFIHLESKEPCEFVKNDFCFLKGHAIVNC